MKKVPLTQGQYALVDDEDYERVCEFKWYAHYSRRTKTFYATRKTKRPNPKHIYMHRFVMNTPESSLCDHLNHDTLDNRKSNLRNCQRSDNSMNRRGAQSNNLIGEKNICFDTKENKYIVAFEIRGIRVFRKRFNTLDEAILARNNTQKVIHKDFIK